MVYHINCPLSWVPPGVGSMSLGIFLADGCARLDSPFVAGASGVLGGGGGVMSSPLDVSAVAIAFQWNQSFRFHHIFGFPL